MFRFCSNGFNINNIIFYLTSSQIYSKNVATNRDKPYIKLFQVSKIKDADQQKVVAMLARCLPHIVPNVLLAKREVSTQREQ